MMKIAVIGLLVLLVLANAALGVYAYRLTGEIDTLGERIETIQAEGVDEPVIQVIAESDGEIVYTIRAKSDTYRPKVYRKGVYTVIVGEPGTEKLKRLTGLVQDLTEKDVIKVIFDQ